MPRAIKWKPNGRKHGTGAAHKYIEFPLGSVPPPIRRIGNKQIAGPLAGYASQEQVEEAYNEGLLVVTAEQNYYIEGESFFHPVRAEDVLACAIPNRQRPVRYVDVLNEALVGPP